MRYLRYFLLCLLLLPSIMQGQTIIELGKSTRHVHSKSYHDYDRKIEHLPAKNDSTKYAQQLTLAYNFLAVDSLKEAKKCLKDCLKMRPKARENYILLRTLGNIALAQEHLPEAADYYGKVLELVPNEYGTRLQRAETMLRIGNAPIAIDDCNMLLPHAQTDSLRSRIHFIKGSAQMMQRQYALAISEFKEIVRLQPEHQNAALLIAMATAADNRPKEALRLINDYIRRFPKDEEALLLRMQLLQTTRKK